MMQNRGADLKVGGGRLVIRRFLKLLYLAFVLVFVQDSASSVVCNERVAGDGIVLVEAEVVVIVDFDFADEGNIDIVLDEKRV